MNKGDGDNEKRDDLVLYMDASDGELLVVTFEDSIEDLEDEKPVEAYTKY